jgi:hypothetical protein
MLRRGGFAGLHDEPIDPLCAQRVHDLVSLAVVFDLRLQVR